MNNWICIGTTSEFGACNVEQKWLEGLRKTMSNCTYVKFTWCKHILLHKKPMVIPKNLLKENAMITTDMVIDYKTGGSVVYEK